MMLAIGQGNLECARMLVDAGADLHVESEAGHTAEAFASASNEQEFSELIRTAVVSNSIPAYCWGLALQRNESR